MANSQQAERLRVRVSATGSGRANVDTGFPVLDRLLALLAEYSGFDIVVALAPGESAAEAVRAAGALGETLAHVVLEVSDRPLLASNVDLSDARVGGLGTDLVTDFLRRLAEGAGITLHVRLIAGEDAQHVLEAMFKALGVALAKACPPPRRKGS